MEDMKKNLSRQKSVAYNAAAGLTNEFAYRPMLIMPNQMSVENLRVNITDNYYQETRNNTLGRYIMLTFTWRFGSFGGGNNRGGFRPGAGGPMGGGFRGGMGGFRGGRF